MATGDKDWGRAVFRLRNIPNHVSTTPEATKLLNSALAVPVDSIVIYSLAKTSDMLEKPPSRVATIQLKTVPSCIAKAPDDQEWEVPMPDGYPGNVLILDIHFRGWTTLNDVDPANHRADCIAISGLASHPFGSWQPHGGDKSFMWIRDALPVFVPGIRAVTYGYDSKLRRSNSFQSISDIARTLILQLKAEGWSLPSSKPIIFLAHSLGGLVLKDAIVQMADREKTVATILEKIWGAIMFGVPSLGMEQSHLLAMVEGQPNESLIQDLSPDSNYVGRLNEQFQGLTFLRTAQILWAYETERSPTVVQLSDGGWSRNGPPAVLVTRDSATCRYYRNEKSLTIPINQDHSNMVKFSRGEATMRVILSSIEEICTPNRLTGQGSDFSTNTNLPSKIATLKHELTLNNAPQQTGPQGASGEKALIELGRLLSGIDDLHNSLHSPELDFRMSQIDDPFQDTFQWVFDIAEFSRWLQAGSGLFWIHGKPGSGKSTLMKYIFNSKETWELLHNWKAGSLELTAAFFFHYRGTAIQKSFEGVLRSLITQILNPHRIAYRKQHLPTWKEFQSLKQQERRITSESDACRKKLPNLEKQIHANRQQLKRADGPEKDLHLAQQLKDYLVGELRLLESEEQHMRSKLVDLDHSLLETRKSMAELVVDFRPHSTSPVTKLLAAIVADFHENDGQILKLERLLRRLLGQEVTKTDLVLFFDALDEFDGNLDLISRFLKDLVCLQAGSMTRVKVLFSSRPWKQLKEHFAEYPGFTLQDHTKSDIEAYAAGRTTGSGVSCPSLIQLLPSVISRADGVFLWVRLALDVLIQHVSTHPESHIPGEILEQKLRALPDDLFKFYELIIERISKSNRRKTYALLELLIRHNGPPITSLQIRDAVLVSECSTYGEARWVLDTAMPHPPMTLGHLDQANNDVYTWGGGLVEIKRDSRDKNVYRPQLMHQTVLEFTMGLSFKNIVLGDLNSIITENGHSFHLKYWSTTTWWSQYNKLTAVSMVQNWLQHKPQPLKARHLHASFPEKDREALEHLLYHAEQSELTTGRNHFDFLCSMPIPPTRGNAIPPTGVNVGLPNDEREFIFLIVSCGLSLCLQEWIARRPARELGRLLNAGAHLTSTDFPLLSSLVFAPPWGVFHDRYLTTIRLLLENGYTPEKEQRFFSWLMTETWYGKLEGSPELISDASLHKLIRWALEFGARPSESISLNNDFSNLKFHVRSIHIAPPPVAADLLRYGADPNEVDHDNCTALDWVVRLPDKIKRKPRDWDLKRRYDTCILLLRAGGVSNHPRGLSALLEEFKQEGYDTEFITERFSAMSASRGFRAVKARIEEFGSGSGSGSEADKPAQGSQDAMEDKDSRWHARRTKMKRVFRFRKGV